MFSEITRLQFLSVLAVYRKQENPAEDFREAQDALDEVRANADSAEHNPRFAHLCKVCDLSPIERDIFLLAVAPAWFVTFDSIFSALAGGEYRGLTPGMIVRILAEEQIAPDACYRALGAQRGLFRMRLLRFADFSAPVYSTPLVPDPRVIAYLSGSDDIAASLARALRPLPAQCDLDDLALPAETRARLRTVAGALSENARLILHLYGPAGNGKQRAASAICETAGRALLRLDGHELLTAAESTQAGGARGAGDRAGIARDITRETLLYDAALLITDWHLLADQPIGRELLAHEFPLMPGPITLTANGRCDVAAPRDWRVASVEFPLPDTALRRQIWERAYNGTGTVDASVSLDFLAAGFRFSENQIQRAALRARAEADLFERGHLTQSDLLAGCYAESNRGLDSLAVRVPVRPRWADLILRPEPQRQLHELCNHVRHSGTVYQGWGFGAGHTSGGVHALFVGSPGTGKTMAASVIAAELGLELYRIDLSSLVSKYIGETEKNLSRIFEEAGTSNAILFFDEADALFGKRGEVKDAQDRYANMEVSYLLQKMEDFPGITILATNFRANLDKAFVRRLNFIVDFPFPDATERMSIWERNLPAEAPVARDVDLAFLAARLDVPGALIKNIARNAAFLAAAEHSAISMRHIRRAAVREYQKDNRPVPDLTVETQ